MSAAAQIRLCGATHGVYYSCGRSSQCAEVCGTLIASCRSTQGYMTDYDTARLNAAVALYSAHRSPAPSLLKLHTWVKGAQGVGWRGG